MRRNWRAFSLIELLTVVMIMVVLAVLAVPALSSMIRGSALSRGGQVVGDMLSVARQEAVTRNRDVEVRFYHLTNEGVKGWRAMQLWTLEQTANGPTTNTSSRVTLLPDGVVIATNNSLSPLVSDSPNQGTVTLSAYGSTPYRSFRFRPNGATEIAVSGSNFLTLVPISDTAAQPANFYTLQVDSLTGKAKVIRP